MNTEAIYSALWAKLTAIPGFVEKSRRLKHWNDVAPACQPAIYMAQGNQTPTTTTGQPSKWLLSAELYIYARTDGRQDPGPILNPLIDAVRDAINAVHPVTGKSLLPVDGVEWARIDGTIETDEGTLGDQAVAIIPLSILAT